MTLTDDGDSSRSADSCLIMIFLEFHCFLLIFVDFFDIHRLSPVGTPGANGSPLVCLLVRKLVRVS